MILIITPVISSTYPVNIGALHTALNPDPMWFWLSGEVRHSDAVNNHIRSESTLRKAICWNSHWIRIPGLVWSAPLLKCRVLFRCTVTPGGTHLERGYGDVRLWRPPFHASPVVRKGPISGKRVSSQDPLLRKNWNFSLYSFNFRSNFSSKAPNLEIFCSQSPKFGNFSS